MDYKKIKQDKILFCRISEENKKELEKMAQYYEMRTSSLLREIIKKALAAFEKKQKGLYEKNKKGKN